VDKIVIIGATPEMIHHWGWFLAFGIVLLLLGIAAIVRSVTATRSFPRATCPVT
jgi:uncharacterized membrane protein HdeD (DUF308 family)